MAVSSLFARLGLWHLTRSAPVRRAYGWMAERGVYVAQLDRFERPVSGDGPDGSGTGSRAGIDGITVSVHRATERLPEPLWGAPVAPGDRVVIARRVADDALVGHGLLSARPVYVPELRRRLAPPGVYCWRLHVSPGERGRGVGTGLVARSVDWTATETDEQSVSALVAPDNIPSRRLFGGLGFRPTVRYTSVGLGDRRWHSDSALDSDG